MPFTYDDLPSGKITPADKPPAVINDPKYAGVTEHGLSVSSYLDYLIHLGDLYNISHRFEDTADKATEKFLIKTAGMDILSVYLEFHTEGAWHIDLYENPTVTLVGTRVVPYNVQRDNTGTINSRFYYTPTAINGTLISTSLTGVPQSGAGN